MSDLQSFLAAIEAKREAMKPNADGLLPCPNELCRDTNPRIDRSESEAAQVRCSHCFVEWSAHANPDDATTSWNHRPLLSDLDTARRLIAKLVEQRDQYVREYVEMGEWEYGSCSDDVVGKRVADMAADLNQQLDAIVREART